MTHVIAEAGLCDNSIEWAHAAVDAAAEVGCWGFKVQMLTADGLASKWSPRYDRLPGPATQHDAFRDALPHTAWAEVKAHCDEVGLEFFASVWEPAALEACEDMGVDWYKVGSADLTHETLLREIRKTGKGVFLSTGGSTRGEVGAALQVLGWRHGTTVIPMACVLSYPASEPALHKITMLLRWFGGPVGYSDHTIDTYTAEVAASFGAEYLEKHFTITPGRGGDHDFALDPGEMAAYVASCQFLMPEEHAARRLARRGLHTTAAVKAGDQLTLGVNCEMLRPWDGGIPANWEGPWCAAHDLTAGQLVRREDVL